MKKLSIVLAFFALSTLGARAAVETYRLDSAHTSIGFKIRHFFTPVPGSFAKFTGTITVDRDDLEKSSVVASIEATSIDTANEKRDGHLRSADFFDVATFPALEFKSTSWKKTGEDTFDVAGDLTIRGQTRPVVLKVKLFGFGPGANGAYLSGWEATTTFDRRDFGLTYGQGVVGNEVEVLINVEAQRQP